MIAALALLLAAVPPAATAGAGADGPPDARGIQARFQVCARQANDDPEAAERAAAAWAASGGGVAAAQCLGLARAAASDWKGAADAFVTAANLADAIHDPNAANLWASAGNAALAGGDAARARAAMSNAIGEHDVPESLRGEDFLDRARTEVAMGDTAAARTDIDVALKFVPADPMSWLLSATLARRTNDLPRAQKDIAEALNRGPHSSDVLYEAGNIAAASGQTDEARAQWQAAVDAEPGSEASDRAKAELAANAGAVAGPPAPAKPKVPVVKAVPASGR